MAEELYTPADTSDSGLYTPAGPSPDLMSALSQVESNGNPNAVGPAIPKYAGTPDQHAIGEFQLLPSTAAQYGMDPHDPDQNRQAAQLHMTHLLNTFGGDEDKAIMAYNAGEGNIKKGVIPAEASAYLQKVRNAQGTTQLYTPIDSTQQAAPIPSATPDLYTPITQPPATPPATPQQQPYFPGDPTAAMANFAQQAGGVVADAFKKTRDAFSSDPDPAAQGAAYSAFVGLVGYGAAMAKLYGGVMTGQTATQSPEQNLATFNDTSNAVNKWMQDTFPSLKTKGQSFEDGAALLGIPQGIAHAANEAAGGGNVGSAIELIAMVALAKPELKAKAKPGALPKLTPDQAATFSDALKSSVADKAVDNPLLPEQMGLDLGDQAPSKAPMLENQTALEAAARATPDVAKEAPEAAAATPDEMGRVEPTLKEEAPATLSEEAPKTAAEPSETPAATETPEPGARTLPEPPGSTPVPDGMVRMYQTFHDEATAQAIEKDGIRPGGGDKGANTGDPPAIYASRTPFYGDGASKFMAEFNVKPEEISPGGNVVLKDHIAPEDVTVHRPSDATARFIENDPKLIRDAVNGNFDKTLGPEDKPALDYIKQKYSDENYGPNKISPLGGVGKKQGGAIQIFSFNDKPGQIADYEKAKAVVGRTDMTAEQFMAKNAVPTKDVRSRIGLGTGSFRTNNELKSNINNPAHAIHVLAYLDDTMHLLKEKFERKILENIYPHTSAFLKYFKDKNYADLKASAPIASWFEKNPGEWFDGKNYSPTLKQLTEKGMSPAAAAAWDHLYKGWEATWSDLLDFAKSKGIDEPARLPGYLPHFTEGAWKVRLFKDTPTGPEYYATIGARNAKEAARLQDAANKLIDPANPDHAGLETEIQQPQTHNDLAGMITGIFEAKDQVHQNAGLSQLLNKLYEQASIGNLKQSLERQETPQILHQMDRIVADKDFQLSPKQASDAVVKMTKIMEGIPAMKMRADFVTKTLFPLESKGYFEGVPNMRTAAEEYMKQFLHIPDNASGHIDGFIKDLFATHGLAPEIPMNIIRSSVGWTSKFYLFYSPKYWAQNMLQKILFMGAAWTAKADLLTFGIKDGSVTKAIMDDLTSTSRGTKLSTGESLHGYMEKTGHATPTFVENMDTSKFMQDPVAKAVEQYTRQGGARLGYNLFKQVFNEKDALAAAGRMTDAMNVPYDSEMGRPFFFAKEGQVGRPLAMFMQYPAHYFQFMSSQIRTLSNATKVSPEATAHAVTGLAYTGAMMIAAGGIAGLPLMMNYNAAIEAINKAFGINWPSTKAWARNIGEFMHKQNFGDEFSNMVAKTSEFGSLGAITGYDISGSLQGPSFQAPQVFMHAVGVFGDAAILGGRWITDQPVSKKELGEHLTDLPSVTGLKASLEHYLRGDSVASLLDKLKGNTSETSPDPRNITLPGYYKRTPMDIFMDFLNIKSTGENAAGTTLRLNSQERQADTITAARIINSLEENPKDSRVQKWLDDLNKIQMRGNIDEVRLPTILKQYDKELRMTGQQREGMAAVQGNKEAKLRWERLQQMRSLEPK